MEVRRPVHKASTLLRRVVVALTFYLAAADAKAELLEAPRYVAAALAWDKLDVSEAHLAIARGANERVKAFARLAARDHIRSAAMLRAAVRSSVNHDPATPVLRPDQARLLAILRTTPTRRIDELYVAHQAQAQAEALALHRAYAAHGAVLELRQVAQLLAPVVQQHVDALHELQQRRDLRGR